MIAHLSPASRVAASNVIPVEKEEETMLPVSYERALAMTPRLVRAVAKVEPTKLGDGYFTAVSDDGLTFTVRLGRVGADTRLRIQTLVSSRQPWRALASRRRGLGLLHARLFVGVVSERTGWRWPWFSWAFYSMGGLVVSGRAFARRRVQRLQERELKAHALLRAFEDAALKGVAGNYRVASGASPLASLDDGGEDAEEEVARSVALRR